MHLPVTRVEARDAGRGEWGYTKFLADMLQSQEHELKAHEEMLAEFQEKHLGELPQHIAATYV